MIKNKYLLDTHALIFWYMNQSISEDFIKYLDRFDQMGHLLVSTISFWEIALLVKKKKIQIPDIEEWKDDLLESTNLNVVDPSINELIQSTKLPDIHKDPFDRVLIVQAISRDIPLVTKDSTMEAYKVKVYWQE